MISLYIFIRYIGRRTIPQSAFDSESLHCSTFHLVYLYSIKMIISYHMSFYNQPSRASLLSKSTIKRIIAVIKYIITSLYFLCLCLRTGRWDDHCFRHLRHQRRQTENYPIAVVLDGNKRARVTVQMNSLKYMSAEDRSTPKHWKKQMKFTTLL